MTRVVLKAGRVVCGEHARTEAGRAILAKVRGLVGEAEERVAVEGALGRAFGDELAALRVALWRLVTDPELDVLDQARAVSEVVGMSVRAARARAARKAGKGRSGGRSRHCWSCWVELQVDKIGNW